MCCSTPKFAVTLTLALLLAGLLVACGVSPDSAERSARGLEGFVAAPLTEPGSERFFGQLASDQASIRGLIAAFEARPRQTYRRVIALDAKQNDRFMTLEAKATDVLVASILNVLATTEEKHAGLGPIKPSELVWYYVDCYGKILTADYNEIFEVQGYFLSEDPPPSLDDIAKALNGDC